MYYIKKTKQNRATILTFYMGDGFWDVWRMHSKGDNILIYDYKALTRINRSQYLRNLCRLAVALRLFVVCTVMNNCSMQKEWAAYEEVPTFVGSIFYGAWRWGLFCRQVCQTAGVFAACSGCGWVWGACRRWLSGCRVENMQEVTFK